MAGESRPGRTKCSPTIEETALCVRAFIQRVELREILTNHIRRGLRLFLVPVRPTNYQGTYLERFQWARPPDQPLSLLDEPQQEKAMVDVCVRIANQLATTPDAPTIEHTR